ncbi:MAG TPA: QsdR family transcriptional regulator [Solirubrobacteraceae bacterium]|nr:QsdR family transcriptional regulator [Solirubrobacteraceae bacterium]
MAAIAGELGVNRVTLYRWFGSRDDFIVEVVWSLALTTFGWVEDKVTSQGPERIVEVVTGFLDTIITNAGMQRWLSEDGEHAMRLLTGRRTDFQQRLIGEIQRRLEEQSGASRLQPSVDLHELAYVIVRLIESYTYLDLITGERPEATRAEPILRMLLRVDA